MERKIIVFVVIFVITVSGLFFIGKNSVFAQCSFDALTCTEYCKDQCRENPAPPPSHIGKNNPIDAFCICPYTTATTIEALVANVTSFIFYLATVIFPLMVALAAFLFATSAGNPTKVGQAKNILLYASVGYGIVILAHALVYVIKNVIGAV